MPTFVEAERIRRLEEEKKREIEKAIKRLCKKDFARISLIGRKEKRSRKRGEKYGSARER